MLADRYDAFLVDLDGVVLVGDEPVAGAVEALGRLRERNTPIRFVTNNSRSTREALAADLRALGIEAAPEEVVTAAWATAEYLAEEGFAAVYLVAPAGFRTEVERQGIAVDREAAEAVVVGLDDAVTYDELAVATRLIHERGVPLVAANVDGAYPTPEGIAPGTGAIVRAIQAATGREPVVVGKPEARLFEAALEGLEGRVAMVGDSLGSDVGGARRAGIAGILVTGVEHAAPPSDADVTPDAVVENLLGLFDEG